MAHLKEKYLVGHELQASTSSRKVGDIYISHTAAHYTHTEVVLIVETAKDKFDYSKFAQAYKELLLIHPDGEKCLFIYTSDRNMHRIFVF